MFLARIGVHASENQNQCFGISFTIVASFICVVIGNAVFKMRAFISGGTCITFDRIKPQM